MSQVPNLKSHRGPVQRLEAVLLRNLRCPCISFVNGCLISSSQRLGAKREKERSRRWGRRGARGKEGEGKGERKEGKIQGREKGTGSGNAVGDIKGKCITTHLRRLCAQNRHIEERLFNGEAESLGPWTPLLLAAPVANVKVHVLVLNVVRHAISDIPVPCKAPARASLDGARVC